MTPSQRNHLLALLGVLLLVWGLAQTPLKARLDGLSVDLLLYARHQVYGQARGPEQSAVVVVALDEQTYRTPPFSGLPHVLWTPQLAKVQDAILAAGARLIGYDIILPTSLESHLPGYEKPFLRSLLQAARQGKLVLGKVQHSSKPVAPHPAQSMVVRHQQNIRALNMHSDSDDVIRRIPLFFQTQDGGYEPSMSLELVARAQGVTPQRLDDGQVKLGDYLIPGSSANAALINFQGGADIPTYSLADLYACTEQANNGENKTFFQQHFANKLVLIGTVLDVEDRKLTSKRLMTEQGAGAALGRCVLEAEAGQNTPRRDSIPGVYILASVMNNLLQQDLLRQPNVLADQALPLAMALLVALASLTLAPLKSLLALIGLILAALAGSVHLLQSQGLVLPLLPLLLAALISYSLILLYRFSSVDREKRRIRSLFSFYLEPEVVNQMLSSDRLPELGGELREVTVWFSDLADFTQLSEGLSAPELVSLMNEYFSVITGIISAHGGFVDKYIGDAIVAVFGAPRDDSHHASRAVVAALMAREALKEMNRLGVFGARQIRTRTGINTGLAVVGNVGSERRFNYTVMGDVVNLASRLEGANKVTGSQILISESVAQRLPESIIVRELASIRVKGKQIATRVYEPLSLLSWSATDRADYGRRDPRRDSLRFTPKQRPDDLVAVTRLAHDFTQAQQDYRNRRFAQMLDRLAPYAGDPAADRLMAKARQYLRQPPPEDWDGVDSLTEK
jgi:class 3 adenylate cyclase/CHASE2 domain-containing sensor protein